ncbi:MAG: hypothetical protein NTV33_06340 [Coprothermobacterota bacterium]|nr:hypothetical protein [Coprothermobacterota bacterium]
MHRSSRENRRAQSTCTLKATRWNSEQRRIHHIDQATGRSKQGTTGVLAWCNEVAALPVCNMRKTSHSEAWRIDGERLGPIGAHHKEAWVITYEINQLPRDSYAKEKAAKVIELQRIRGGLFEFLPACRFPWVELGWAITHYADYFNQATGLAWTMDDFWRVADRIYALMKAFWAREYPDWDRSKDCPPAVWFDPANADQEGPIAGKVLDRGQYERLLDDYCQLRGWDHRGIPTKAAFAALGLDEEANELQGYAVLE